MYKSYSLICWTLLFIMHGIAGYAVTADTTVTEQISIRAATSAITVPQNHLLPFTIVIEWEGSAQLYTIDDFNNPALTNFSIAETASANRVEDRQGTLYTIKEYTYQLQPLELGMGYIDGVIVKYTNTGTGISNRIITKRIAVEVTAPIFERDWNRIITGGSIGLGVLIVLLFIMMHMRKRASMETTEPEPINLEEVYLDKLKHVKGEATGTINDKLAELNRLLRVYLTDKYTLESSGLGLEELLSTLERQDVHEGQRTLIRDVLATSDVYKFSGQSIDLGEYELLYTKVLSIIEHNHSKSATLTNTSEDE